MWVSEKHAFQEALENLVKLAQDDGTKHYAWHEAKQLEAQEHGMYRGICEALKERMKVEA